MKPLYIIDGYGLIYRSYFAFARTPMRGPGGRPNGAVFGFFRSLLAIIRDYQAEDLVLALDSKGPTFRDAIYPEYKATRQKTPDDLKAQFPVIDAIVEALRLPSLRVEGFEADDLIATLARQCAAQGRDCRIVSADKDLMQLVDQHVRMLRPAKTGGFEEMDADGVRADKGIGPEQILDYLSLLGDSSDNVPGVAGIGEKTALKLLAEYGNLDAVYAALDTVQPTSLRDKLEKGRDMAMLSRRLVTLDCAVPGLDAPAEGAFSLSGIDGSAAARLLRDEGIRQLAADWEAFAGGEAAPDAEAPVSLRRYDPAAAKYRLISTLADLETLVRHLENSPVLCVDTETTGLDPHRARLCGLALCASPGQAWYVAFLGPEGPVIDLDAARPLVARLLSNPAIALVGQNLKFDWQILCHHGLEPYGAAFDTMVAAWLVDSTRAAYNMDALSRDYLGYEPIPFASLFSTEDQVAGRKEPERLSFDRVALDRAAVYSAEDADVTLQLYGVLKGKIAEAGLEHLLGEVEMPLVPLLARLEYGGMGLDPLELEAFSVELEQRLDKIQSEIHALVGHPFNINSPKQLAQVLFEERKLQTGKKTRTGFSTDTSVLEELADLDPVPRLVLAWRSLAKLKGTYVDTLPALLNPLTGRIHTSLSQTGTATGRLSSRDPNLQNIPIKDDDGRRIRQAFVAAPGHVFVSADYSQIELVVMAHLADDPGLRAAFAQGVDIHRHTGSLIFGIGAEAVSPEQRRIAKTINFGVLYGMSAFRLSNELKIPNRQAAAFIEAYFASYPGIKAFVQKTVAACEADGGVHTILGRWRPIPAIHSANKTEKQAAERVAVNTPIQGSAADIVKLAMIRMDQALSSAGLQARLILQVHDELIFEVPEAEVGTVMDLCRTIMPTVLPLSVPLGVNVESARRWGDMH